MTKTLTVGPNVITKLGPSLHKRVFPKIRQRDHTVGGWKDPPWFGSSSVLFTVFVPCHRFGNVSEATDVFLCLCTHK